MSLAECKRTFNRTLVEVKQKAKLIIPNSALKKIDYLHKKVGSDEWSCILVYKIKEGIIENPEGFVLEVVDLIPMDVGNATYTEYDFSTDDEYSFDKYTTALQEGYKIGHLHSHHNMQCFFSGTDTAELHDNAPAHNFYVSLIVNFKDPSQWCAAIASCYDEEIIGSYKKVGKITTTRKFKGSTNGESTNTDDEFDEIVPVNEIKHTLYKINLEIVTETIVETYDEDFTKRVADLQAKKASKHIPYYRGTGAGNMFNEIGYNYDTGRSGGSNQSSKFQQKTWNPETKKWEEEKTEKDAFQIAEEQMANANLPLRIKDCYSPNKVRPFLIFLLGGKEGDKLHTAITQFIATGSDPKFMEYQLGDLEEKFQQKADYFFKMSGEDLDYNCIAASCIDLLCIYEQLDVYKLLMDCLDTYMYPSNVIDYKVVEKLTGLMFEDVITDKDTDDNTIDMRLRKAEALLRTFDVGGVQYLPALEELIELGADEDKAEDLLGKFYETNNSQFSVEDFIKLLPSIFKIGDLVTENPEHGDFHENV